MVCLSGRELRNTTRNLLIMFVLKTNFADPNNQTGYPSRKSANKSGATCFETVDDLGGADGLAGNSLDAQSHDSITNFKLVEVDLDPEMADWREYFDDLKQYKYVKEGAIAEPFSSFEDGLHFGSTPDSDHGLTPEQIGGDQIGSCRTNWLRVLSGDYSCD